MKTISRILKLAIVFAFIFTELLSQEYILQVSSDSSHLNIFPQVYFNTNGNVWITYISEGSRFIGGYVQNAVWHETANIEIPFGIGPWGNKVSSFVNNAEQIWFAHVDTTSKLRIEFIENNKWTAFDSIIYYAGDYGYFSNTNKDVCYFNNLGNEITLRKVVGGEIQTIIRQIVDLDIFWHTPRIFFLSPINLPNDSIAFTMGYGYEEGLLGPPPYYQGTFINNSSSGSVLELEVDGLGNGSYPVCSSAIGIKVFVFSQYNDPLSFYRYGAFLVDSTIRKVWKNVLAHVDVDSSQYSSYHVTHCFKAVASNHNTCVALAWIANDTLRLKMLRDTVWTIATTIVNPDQSSLQQLNIAVASDTTVYVTYSALKNGNRHVFLSKIQSSFLIDTVLTSVPSEYHQTMPNGYSLKQNYPNPFNPSTNIIFSIPKRSFVFLKVFDLVGREVATIVSEDLSAGDYSRQWTAVNISTGVYFYRLQAGSFTETKKLIILK